MLRVTMTSTLIRHRVQMTLGEVEGRAPSSSVYSCRRRSLSTALLGLKVTCQKVLQLWLRGAFQVARLVRELLCSFGLCLDGRTRRAAAFRALRRGLRLPQRLPFVGQAQCWRLTSTLSSDRSQSCRLAVSCLAHRSLPSDSISEPALSLRAYRGAFQVARLVRELLCSLDLCHDGRTRRAAAFRALHRRSGLLQGRLFAEQALCGRLTSTIPSVQSQSFRSCLARHSLP